MATTTPTNIDSDHQTPRSSESCSSKYKGVRKRKWGKWVSEIRLPNSRERIWLGSYDSPEKAARAFDAALYCLRGPHANFNFPRTPLELELTLSADHQSLSPQKIQELAARFANEHQQDPPLLHQSSSQPPASSSCFDSDRVTESGYNDMYDGTALQVDQQVGDIRGLDWSFLNSLDDAGNFDYYYNNGLCYGLDKMHSGELYPTSPPPLLTDNDHNGDAFECDDAFSQQSLFLWNFESS